MIRTTLVAVLLAAIVPLGLHAQDRYQTQVRSQMIVARGLATLGGYTMTSQYYRSQLRDSQSETINLSFSGSREYLVVAMCDNDCSDIDLNLYEPDGTRSGYDMRNDDYPTIRVGSGHNGAHQVKVTMASCSVNPCRYEIAVFER